MANHSVLPGSNVSNDSELIDSGWSSNDNLTDVTKIDDTLSTMSYPISTMTIRSSSMSEAIGGSTVMDSSTLVSSLTNISSTISMESVRDTRASSVSSRQTYTGPFVLTKDYDYQNESSYSIMSSYPTTAPEDMFPPYQRVISDNEDDLRQKSRSKLVLYICKRNFDKFYRF